MYIMVIFYATEIIYDYRHYIRQILSTKLQISATSEWIYALQYKSRVSIQRISSLLVHMSKQYLVAATV